MVEESSRQAPQNLDPTLIGEVVEQAPLRRLINNL